MPTSVFELGNLIATGVTLENGSGVVVSDSMAAQRWGLQGIAWRLLSSDHHDKRGGPKYCMSVHVQWLWLQSG